MKAPNSPDSGPQIVFQDDNTIVTRYTADDIASIVNAPTPVSANAVVKRINRRLSTDNRQLLVCRRDCPHYPRTGRYYLTDQNLNAVIDMHVDLEALAQELDVLNKNERIGD